MTRFEKGAPRLHPDSPYTAMWQAYEGRIALMVLGTDRKYETIEWQLAKLMNQPDGFGDIVYIQPIGSVETEVAIAYSRESRAGAVIEAGHHLVDGVREYGKQAEERPFKALARPNDFWSILDLGVDRDLGQASERKLSLLAVSNAVDYNGTQLGGRLIPQGGLTIAAKESDGQPAHWYPPLQLQLLAPLERAIPTTWCENFCLPIRQSPAQ